MLTDKKYVKTPFQIETDKKIIDSRLNKLTPSIINRIGENAKIQYQGSIFRPQPDLALLIFKKDKISASEYTINIITIRPTMASINKTEVPSDIVELLN